MKVSTPRRIADPSEKMTLNRLKQLKQQISNMEQTAEEKTETVESEEAPAEATEDAPVMGRADAGERRWNKKNEYKV